MWNVLTRDEGCPTPHKYRPKELAESTLHYSQRKSLRRKNKDIRQIPGSNLTGMVLVDRPDIRQFMFLMEKEKQKNEMVKPYKYFQSQAHVKYLFHGLPL